MPALPISPDMKPFNALWVGGVDVVGLGFAMTHAWFNLSVPLMDFPEFPTAVKLNHAMVTLVLFVLKVFTATGELSRHDQVPS